MQPGQQLTNNAEQFAVDMPPGTVRGQMMQVISPDGQPVQFPAPGGVAPGCAFPVAFLPMAARTSAAAILQPVMPPIDTNEMVRLDAILKRFEINLAQAVDLHVLRNYEIIVIADDSGSMMTYEPAARKTRWEELKETLSLIVEVGSCFDTNGLDIYFLNRQGVKGVTSAADPSFLSTLSPPPAGSTPLTETLQLVHDDYKGIKPVLLMILTDGVPNGGPTAFTHALRTLVTGKKSQGGLLGFADAIRSLVTAEVEEDVDEDRTIFRVQIMACTDDDDAIGWINVLDKELKELDATDDYYAERQEVLRAGHIKEFTRGDWCMKAMLGAVSEKFDRLDERGILDFFMGGGGGYPARAPPKASPPVHALPLPALPSRPTLIAPSGFVNSVQTMYGVGTIVDYFSESKQAWLLAKVVAIHLDVGLYDLDIKPQVRPQFVRRHVVGVGTAATGQNVEYLSVSQNVWMPAKIIGQRDCRGSITYDLEVGGQVRQEVPAFRIRWRTDAANSSSAGLPASPAKQVMRCETIIVKTPPGVSSHQASLGIAHTRQPMESQLLLDNSGQAGAPVEAAVASVSGPASRWSVPQVVQFITDLGLGHISEKFRENAVDGQMLLGLSEDDMCTELGLQKLQARKVFQRLPK